MRAWKQRGLALLLAGVLCLGGSTGLTTLAYAEETEKSVTETEEQTTQDNEITQEESVYPEAWDADDPMNERAYAQLQTAEDVESYSEGGYDAPRLEAENITTTYGNNTYTHRELNTSNTTLKLGIDVSYFNNYNATSKSMTEIDWDKVKATGVEFVIIRIGYRTSADGTLCEDQWFAQNYQGAKEAGLEVGSYFFSQAINTEEAVEEAEFAISVAEKYNCQFDLPIAFDIEELENGRFTNANLSKKQKTDDCLAFCGAVKDAGYDAMVYSGSWYFVGCLDASAIQADYPLWSARYNSIDYDSVKDAGKAFYSGRIDYWQCSGSASVAGVPSQKTDLDYYYCPNNSIQVRLDSDGVRRCYDADGNLDDTYTGLCKGSDGWWYVINGVVDTTYSGLVSNAYGCWKVESGKVNFDYCGFAENSDGWWYVANGKVQTDTNDIVEGIVNDTAGWWYVKDGRVDFTYIGLAKNSYGWWYVKDGQVDFTYTGLAKNSYGWWYVKDGQVDFTYTGLAENEYGWWYVKNGRIGFDTTTVMKCTVNGTTAWWYVNQNKIDETAETVAKNDYGWWYIKDGQVDFTYTGLAKNNYGWWYVKDGQVDFTYTGLAKNNYGWWYLKNGKVNFTYSGVAKNSYGWWRIESGKVNFSFHGIAKNSYGWWYLINGKVDFSYSGTVRVNVSSNQISSITTNTVTYSVTGGKVKK